MSLNAARVLHCKKDKGHGRTYLGRSMYSISHALCIYFAYHSGKIVTTGHGHGYENVKCQNTLLNPLELGIVRYRLCLR